MIKTTVEVNGMMCGMCESHVNEAVRKNFTVKKVQSSHTKGQTEILSEEELDQDKLKDAIGQTGYEVGSIQSEPYQKKGFLSGLFSKK